MNIEELKNVLKPQLDMDKKSVLYAVQYQTSVQKGTDRVSLSFVKHNANQLSSLLDVLSGLRHEETIDGCTPLFVNV